MADSRDFEEKKAGSAPETKVEKTTVGEKITYSVSGEEDRDLSSGTFDASGSKSGYGEEFEEGGTLRGAGNVGMTGSTDQQPGLRKTVGSVGAGQTSEQVKEKATQMAQDAKIRGKGFVDEQRRSASESLERFASVLHDTGDRIEEDQPTFSQFFHSGASGVDHLAGILRERDTDQMLHDIQDFGRRHPGLMLGSMVAAGFFLSRVLKSSSTHTEADYESSRLSGVREKVGERFGKGEEKSFGREEDVRGGEDFSTYREYREGQDISGLSKSSTEEERHATD